jgi:TatD DNase family protein
LETDTVEEGIQEVYALAAKYKGISMEEIQKIVNSNFNTIFNK